MAVGFPAKTNFATGDVLTATNMNDITGTLNLLESAQYAAGKNEVINGNFDIWQRGTTFSTTDTYSSDRWRIYLAGAGTITRDSTLVPAGSSYGARLTSGSAGFTGAIAQSIETLNAISFAGKTVTLSAQIAGTVGKTAVIQIAYSTSDNVSPFGAWTSLVASSPLTVSGTYQRFTISGTLPSTTRSIRVYLGTDGTLANTEFLTFGQVQLEAASTASPFQTASGSIGGELALCQRYYYRNSTTSVGTSLTNTGGSLTTTLAEVVTKLPVTMRTAPVTLETLSIGFYNYANTTVYSSGTFVIQATTPDYVTLRYTHGSAVLTAGQVGTIVSSANPSYIAFSSEL